MHVPEGWKNSDIRSIVKHKKGFAFKSTLFNSEKGRRVIRVSDTTANSIKIDGAIYLAEEDASQHREYELRAGDIILTTVGSRPPLYDSMVGKAIKVPTPIDGALLNQNMVKLTPIRKVVEPEYLYTILKTKKFLFHIEQSVRGNANQVSITLDDIFDFSVILPPIPEQQKIAQILSTWDKAIEKLETLIAAKQKRKKALMQQLLTGKKRFAGFKGAWKNSYLTEHCHVGTGGKDLQNAEKNGLYPFFVRSQNIERINSYSYDGEAILIPGDGRVGEIYHYINGRFDYHQRVYKISDFKGVIGKFIYYYLMEFFKKEVKRHSAKATVDSLRMPIFTEMKLKIPELNEQQKIAAVLSSADTEIETHKKQLSALKQQKKGLMQQLLTGKKRVNIDEPELLAAAGV